MWRLSWAAKQPNSLLLGVICLMVVAACSPDQQAPVAPTLTLIPPTLTYTPAPVTPTATQPALPGAAEISSTLVSPASLSAEATPNNPFEADPVAAELVAMAQRRLAQELNLTTRRLQPVAVEPVVWTDTSLGCPLPDQVYAPAEIDGYRIVLSAGDREYIFHTDFDRVLPCEAANEQLPEATTEP